jgi:hypothetical protein
VRRYFFHVVKGHQVIEDAAGKRLRDLGAVVRQAERLAVQIIVADDSSPRDWTHWKLDVIDDEGTRLFFYPFDFWRAFLGCLVEVEATPTHRLGTPLACRT